VQRSEDGCEMRQFCKTVLNLLEAVYLRLRKIVVEIERVTVVKFRMDNRGSDGTSKMISWLIRLSSHCRSQNQYTALAV